MNFSSSKLLTLPKFASRTARRCHSAALVSKRCHNIGRTVCVGSPSTSFYRPLTLSSSSSRNTPSTSTRPFSSLAVDEHDSDSPRKTIPFMLADIGEGIAEVELLQWYVSAGDHVAQFDRVCEVQSDKATVEITSRFDGIVESLNGKVGDMIKVGTPLMHISIVDRGGGGSTKTETQETGEPSKETSASTASEPKKKPPTTLHNVDDEADKLHIPRFSSDYDLAGDDDIDPKKNKVFATPAVRKLGMEHNLDLSHIVGTGPKGRVLKADVLKIIHDKEGRPPMATTAQPTTSVTSPAPVVPKAPVIEEDTTVDVKGYNRMMIKTMTASLQIPHMHYGDEINMDEMLRCKKDLQRYAEEHGIKLSLTPFAIKAVSLALKEFPAMNSTINVEERKITYKASHNIGVAMDTPRGLAVPVIKGCQNLSVLEIAAELNRLKQLGQESSLSESDISDATFSISNMGAIGGTYMSPVVVPPQVAIGAMGRIQKLPRIVDGHVEEVNIMQMSWGGDHRAIDGATMARFSNQWKEYMENPMTMLFSMK